MRSAFGRCPNPLEGRGRHKWCKNCQPLARKLQRNKKRNRAHQRDWRERHPSLYMNQRAIYRAVQWSEKWLLKQYPQVRRRWLHLALLSGYKEALAGRAWPKSRHFFAYLGLPGSWEAEILLDFDSNHTPKFGQPWHIHFARKLYRRKRSDDAYCAVKSPDLDLAKSLFPFIHNSIVYAKDLSWDGRSFGIMLWMPDVAKALGREDKVFVYCRTVNGSVWQGLFPPEYWMERRRDRGA